MFIRTSACSSVGGARFLAGYFPWSLRPERQLVRRNSNGRLLSFLNPRRAVRTVSGRSRGLPQPTMSSGKPSQQRHVALPPSHPEHSQPPARPALSVALSAAVGSLLFGYDTGIIGGALLYIIPEFHLEKLPGMQGAIVSAALIGAVVGTALAGPTCDLLGRRRCLLGTSLLFMTGGGMMAAASGVSTLIAGRFVVGVAVGAASAVVPVFIAECAPASARGRLATLPQLMVSSGILLSYCTAFVCSLATAPQWRLMLGLSILPALGFAGLILWLPESPRWLCLKGRRADALEAAARLGLPSSELPAPEDVNKEMRGHLGSLPRGGATEDHEAEGLLALPSGSHGKAPSVVGGLVLDLSELLSDPACRWALTIGCSLQAFQQVCGINAIVYFTPEILSSAGAVDLLPLPREAASILATILAYSLKVPSILLAMVLMDRAGRRPLLLFSLPLMGLALLMLAASFHFLPPGSLRTVFSMLAISLYGCSFVLGLGPIPTIVASEIFPTHLRGLGVGLCVGVNFACNVAVSQAFPEMMQTLGLAAVCSLYSLMCLFAWLTVFFALPETKGLRLEEASSLFRPRDPSVLKDPGH